MTLSNTGTAALPVISVGASSGFLIKSNDRTNSLAAGAHCLVTVVFQPTAKGPATGILTIKDVNCSSPQTVALTGTGG